MRRGRFELSLGAGCGATVLLGAIAGLYSDWAVRSGEAVDGKWLVMVGWWSVGGWWLIGL